MSEYDRPEDVVAALSEIARSIRLVAHGELEPAGLEGLTMAISGDPRKDSSLARAVEGVDSSLLVISSSLDGVAKSIDNVARAIERLAEAQQAG